MRIFKVKQDGVIYKVYEAIRDFNELIIGWKFVGSTIYNYQAYGYIRQHGRQFNPSVDRVMKVWQDGLGTFMRRR